MNTNEPQSRDSDPGELPARKTWAMPTVTRLRSGSADNMPGDAINDSPLETIGS